VPIKRSASLPMLMPRILANCVKGNRDGRRSMTTTAKMNSAYVSSAKTTARSRTSPTTLGAPGDSQ
jgi:hypothetical protein